MMLARAAARPAGDDYVEGDVLADMIVLARSAAEDARLLGGYCIDCRGTCYRPQCVRGRLLAWLARIDGEAA